MKTMIRTILFSLFIVMVFGADNGAQANNCLNGMPRQFNNYVHTGQPTNFDNFIYRGKPTEFYDFGYLVRGAAWVFTGKDECKIYVCWENPTKINQDARGWIRDQIQKTWEHHTALKFSGWQKCGKTNWGIRILISDEPPVVKKFGKNINKIENGMVLNTSFLFWSPSEDCSKQQEKCTRHIAVHEFGHALGFAHEHNRPDTPGECSKKHGQPGQEKEKILTPFDPKSVMNYCNLKNNNAGFLSQLDIKAAQKIYGKPSNR